MRLELVEKGGEKEDSVEVREAGEHQSVGGALEAWDGGKRNGGESSQGRRLVGPGPAPARDPFLGVGSGRGDCR